LPTLTKQVTVALDMLDLKPGETMIELGCGDGKVLIAAAQRGWKVVGIELNPILVVVCKMRTWRYRKQVRVVMGNYWDISSWPPASGIFGFVLPKYMLKLDDCIMRWQAQHIKRGKTAGSLKPVKLASFAFTIPGKKVVREQDGVYLYKY
jgi:SAM-dependent methyltransferase